MTTISNRALIRIFCFAAAALLALAGAVVAANAEAEGYRRQLEQTRLWALQEAAGSLHSISLDLEKSTYAGSPAQFAGLSARVWKNAGSAKQSLASLPMEQTGLETTYRFLSQVGDYCLYLSDKVVGGGEITQEERLSLRRLMDYSRTLGEQLAALEQMASSGEVEQARLWMPLSGQIQGTMTDPVGFTGVEQAMEGYPKLIYDGPFSDNLLDKRPALTDGMAEAPRVQAQQTAARFAGVAPLELRPGPEEDSLMPSYTFTGEYLDIGVTKQGGYVTYLTDSRPVGQRALTTQEARKRAAGYLQEMLESAPMKECFYEVAAGICTVNFAARQGDVTLYTDQIKVGVAMDDGRVVFYDARGYISSHHSRILPTPALGQSQAQQAVSPGLEVRSAGLALIPTASGEALTYEFRCKGADNQDVLVYINGHTGKEEAILLVVRDENGVLTV